MTECADCGHEMPAGALECVCCGCLGDASAERAFAEEALFSPGTIVAGKYLIEKELGRGGMAVVYHAMDKTLERNVALKILRARYSADPVSVRRFLGEARRTAKLDHPGIVTVYEAQESGESRYIAMKLVEGETLAARLKKGRLNEPDALRVARAVADALGYAHSMGIIHRDLKPANIILRHDGQPLIADFGIAKEIDVQGSVLTQTGTIIGTPDYMGPEQAAGDKITPRSDLYSLGVVLFEMLAGIRPFTGRPMAVLRAHIYDAPPRLDSSEYGVSGQVARIVSKLLAKNPAERFASGAELADALAENMGSSEEWRGTPKSGHGEVAGEAMISLVVPPKVELAVSPAKTAAESLPEPRISIIETPSVTKEDGGKYSEGLIRPQSSALENEKEAAKSGGKALRAIALSVLALALFSGTLFSAFRHISGSNANRRAAESVAAMIGAGQIEDATQFALESRLKGKDADALRSLVAMEWIKECAKEGSAYEASHAYSRASALSGEGLHGNGSAACEERLLADAAAFYVRTDYARARVNLELAIGGPRAAENCDAHWMLGVIYKSEERIEESLNEFEKVLETEGSGDWLYCDRPAASQAISALKAMSIK
jgi:serine/threonine protein kinase